MHKDEIISRVAEKFYKKHKISARFPWEEMPSAARVNWESRIRQIVNLLEEEGVKVGE